MRERLSRRRFLALLGLGAAAGACTGTLGNPAAPAATGQGGETVAAPTGTPTSRLPVVANPATPTASPIPTATSTSLPGKLIALDPGHDRLTGGAEGREWRHTWETAAALRDILLARGYQVEMTRPTLETTFPGANQGSYQEGFLHGSAILALKPDLAIAIHYNGGGSAAQRWTETFWCARGQAAGADQNQRLAQLVHAELLAALRGVGYSPIDHGANEDNTIGKPYGHLATLGNVTDGSNRMVGLPAILTEALFETNPTEAALIARADVRAALAEGYARAVDAFFRKS